MIDEVPKEKRPLSDDELWGTRVPKSPVCAKGGLWPYPCSGRLELQRYGWMKGSFLCEEHRDYANRHPPIDHPPNKVPDRVIDAPIPEDLKDRHALLRKWIYGPVMEHDPMPHESSLRNELALIERIARLEAEKQEAHTEGWNAAIEAACDKADFGMIAPEDVRALAKPTAAKQGDPSSANRAEGRP